MPKAIKIYGCGDPSVMVWEEVGIAEPSPTEILIEHTAIGLNFIDIYHRSGFYKVPNLPFTPGIEGVGIVVKCGQKVRAFKEGDRVIYGKGPIGAYSHYRTIEQDRVVKLPKEISDEHAVGAMVQGLTAHFLLNRTYRVRQGTTILVHAAAGGIGTFLCQWANLLGATVIGTVGSEEKAHWAQANGCHHTILYRRENFVEKVREITNGKMCNIVYDSVGKDTIFQSMDCLMKFGLLVSYGQSSGPIPPIDPRILSAKGSLFFTRPSLMDYKEEYAEYSNSALEVFNMIITGRLKVNIGQSYYLSDVARAHYELENRMTIGSSILIPDPK